MYHPTENMSHVDYGQKIRLGEMLVNRGMITQNQLEQALEHQASRGHKRLLGEVMVELNFLSEHQIMEALAECYGVPFVADPARIADPKIIEKLPRDFVEQHGVLPLFSIRDDLTVAISEPANLYLIDEIERVAEQLIQIVASTSADIDAALRSYLPEANVFVIDDIYEDIDDEDFSLIEKQVTELSDLEEAAGHSPVVKLVNFLIYSAVQDSASDIHIEPDDHRLRVRYRVDGKMYEKISPPYQMHPAITSRIKIMSNLDISERRMPQDGDIHVMMEGRPIDLRVSTMPGKHGEKVVIRIIDTRNALVSMDKLGFAQETLDEWHNVVNQPNGIVLVTGPTGSGKSTTLYSVLSQLNKDYLNISTVEDPIEANLLGVNQFQVNEKAGFHFAIALRSLLRQDPDIMMVGEVRDEETATVVVQAALTGHLVLTTLHTNDAPSAVTRLVNIGIEPYLVAAVLRAVLAQRLVRKICPHCKESYTPDSLLLETLEANGHKVEQLYRGQGCSRCRGTGFAGRLGIFELLVPNEELLCVIAQGENLQVIRSHLAMCNLKTLRSDGLTKATQGLTTAEEVFYATSI